MISIIIVFGLITFIAGAIIVINPETIFGLIRHKLEKLSLQLLAIVIRLALGILLIQYADESKFPAAIEIIGWLSIAAAITFSFIGRQRFVDLMTWAPSLLKPYGQVGGVIAIAFGGFLIYAFV